MGHVVFHGLDHDNGVIHHDPDRQHQAKERQNVDREPQHREEDERADERHGHGEEGNQRGTPVLQEDEHHQNDQDDGLVQRLGDFMDGFTHEQGAIEVIWYASPWGNVLCSSCMVLTT